MCAISGVVKLFNFSSRDVQHGILLETQRKQSLLFIYRMIDLATFNMDELRMQVDRFSVRSAVVGSLYVP
jgi:hypothetical protein